MPSGAEILDLLARMSHSLWPLAVAWHILILGVVVALALGWRPTNHYGVLMLAAPALSVSLSSLAFGNPFNGIAMGVLAFAIVLIGGARNYRAVASQHRWTRLVGIALVVYGFAYPHFAAGWPVLYAPVGIVPCPTLAVISGFVLLADGFDAPALPALLTAWTAFYALFGVAKLGVMLDLGLFAAVGGLAALVGRSAGRPHAVQGG